ncbi:MAG: hypothetical protein ACM37W_21230, partial [Actinomycetota bacterium]
MQLEKPLRPIKPRRLPKRRPVQPWQRSRTQLSRLKYGNILSLVATAIAISWTINLALRSKHSTEPPVIVAQPPALAAIAPLASSNPPSSKDEPKFAYNVKAGPNQVYSQEL